MAFNRYRFTLKSEELRGAGQPNIIYVGLASDADAATFAGNLEVAYAADVVTVDSEIATNYALPYPVGTGSLVRMVMRSATGIVDTEYFYDLKAGSDVSALSSQLITDGILLPVGTLPAAASINMAVFTPGESV